MSFWLKLKALFDDKQDEESFEFVRRASGVFDNDEDYRDIYLGSFQKAKGAPSTFIETLDTLKSLPQFDQRMLPVCVPTAHAKLLMLYLYRAIGYTIQLSPRYAWQICKLFDGVTGPGTFPRISALVFTKFGCCTETLLSNNTTLPLTEYTKFLMTGEMMADTKGFKFPGFAFVDPHIDAIKEAIYQNLAVVGTTEVGLNWKSLPLKAAPSTGPHHTLWYGYETLPNGDTKIFIDNSWGPKWLSWIKSWLFPGKGYFLWSEHKNTVRDIIAFTTIPVSIHENAKKAPYKFTSELQPGYSNLAVMELQKLLNENPFTAVALDGAGSPGNETTFFGTATLNALKKWQMIKGLPSTGHFGKLSIQKANERIKPMNLIDALILVESGGDDNAVGDTHLLHHAYGCLQIRQPAVSDTFPGHKAQECLGNREFSIQVFEAYMKRYANEDRLGRAVSDEDRARIWNGGPNGYRSEATLGYWKKVKVLLNN